MEGIGYLKSQIKFLTSFKLLLMVLNYYYFHLDKVALRAEWQ